MIDGLKEFEIELIDARDPDYKFFQETRNRLRDLYNVVCKMGFEPDLLIEQLKATNSL
jgi:hypothetical protein